MKRIFAAAALLPLLTLGACGDTMGDRALSGGGIGAGAGLLAGLAFHRPLEGALIGGALGAGAGALTTRDQVNMGQPVWRQNNNQNQGYNQGYQNQNYQGQSYQNRNYQNQGYQNQNYQGQNYQN
jgi:osmotically inducible lipoprotein OsmB